MSNTCAGIHAGCVLENGDMMMSRDLCVTGSSTYVKSLLKLFLNGNINVPI